MKREDCDLLCRELSRRAVFRLGVKSAALFAALSQLDPLAFGDTKEDVPQQVVGAIGNIVIPVDEDPGWATFEPDISAYALNVFIKQVFLAGNQRAFDAFLELLRSLNEIPVQINYGRRFLEMDEAAQETYFREILTGQFENDGVQEILSLAGNVCLLTTKAVFFSNFPYHLAEVGSEYQNQTPAGAPRTGFAIMGFRGAVGPDEEEELRRRFLDAEEVLGVDWSNPYI